MKKSFKQTCIGLREKDYTLNEIVKITGRGKTSVYFHIKNIPLSALKQRSISEASKKRALDNSANRKGKSLRSFSSFPEWTPQMVLLVSHMMFDGELKKGRCRYHNRSRTLVERVEQLMRLIYEYPPKKTVDSLSGVITLGFYNVALQAYLYERSQDLITNIVSLPQELQKEFLRAFFDDEGCMDYRMLINKRMIRGYQDDRQILLLVEDLLGNFGIESTLQGRNEVVIRGKENLIKFRDEINFSKGVSINPNRTNSIWKKNIEKRVLLDMAIESFKK